MWNVKISKFKIEVNTSPYLAKLKLIVTVSVFSSLLVIRLLIWTILSSSSCVLFVVCIWWLDDNRLRTCIDHLCENDVLKLMDGLLLWGYGSDPALLLLPSYQQKRRGVGERNEQFVCVYVYTEYTDILYGCMMRFNYRMHVNITSL